MTSKLSLQLKSEQAQYLCIIIASMYKSKSFQEQLKEGKNNTKQYKNYII